MQYRPVLISVALKYILKAGSVSPQTFLYIFKTIWTILNPSSFHIVLKQT